MQTAKIRVRDGRATTTVAAAGPGAYTVAVEFDPPGRLVAGRAGTRAKTSIRDLSVGSTGADVVGLTRKLDQLNIHVPPRSLTFSDTLTHAVIAFQKVTGLPRTGAMTTTDWQQLARTKPVRATQTGPPDRIEVDKTRQILIKVVDREVAGVLPVSTGRTGNTPEGIRQIRWKAPSSTTWLGPGILYRAAHLRRQQLRAPRLGRGADLPGQRRLRSHTDLVGRLALRRLPGGRDRDRAPLRPS